jgi:hypothetical protein
VRYDKIWDYLTSSWVFLTIMVAAGQYWLHLHVIQSLADVEMTTMPNNGVIVGGAEAQASFVVLSYGDELP